MKKISTRTHGMIDYGTSLGMLVLPRLLRWNPGVVRLLMGSAIVTTIYSMMTKYELGVFKILPMKAHLALDGAQSMALASAPFLFVNSRRSVTGWLLGMSVFEALVTLNTQTHPKRKILWFKF